MARLRNLFKSCSIQKKFFAAMLLSSGASILILLLIASLLLFWSQFRQQTISSEKQLDYISEQLNFYLESVDNYSRTIISDGEIQSCFSRRKYDRNFSIDTEDARITEILCHVIQSTDYIHQVTLYDLEKKPLFTTALYPVQSDAPEEIESETGTWLYTRQISNYAKSRAIPALSFFRPFFSYETGEKLGYIEIAVPEASISAIYASKTTEYNSLFLTDRDGRIVSTLDYQSIGELFTDFERLRPDSGSSHCFTFQAVLFGRHFPKLNWYLVNRIGYTEFFFPILLTGICCVGAGILLLAVCAMSAHRIARTITAPIQSLIGHMRTIRNGQWLLLPDAAFPSDQDMHLLFESFNRMITAQEALKNELVSSQREKDRMSLDLLQQQINPHFLYNTLDNICSLAEIGESDILVQMVMNLSSFYRNTLSSGRFHITVREELEITKAYLKIMEIRKNGKFRFSVDCREEAADCECIKLLLQPIVENSIYHGFSDLDTQGSISIQAYCENDCVILKVEDNGCGFSREALEGIWNAPSHHFGIRSIHQRIVLYYGEEYGMQIRTRPGKGCITTLTLPERRQTHEASVSDH